ncbi:MAG TPA: phosphoglycerate kinase [Spirochaetota bacterium]|nr:phosphoglycerate kinase [Spirochaetota bacterium]HRZ26654.1 phosphoglycerate kinase [Spirochaetota bacterium]
MTIKYLKDVSVDGKKVLLRVDYNVPYDKQMSITDDTRITATVPTIQHCIDRKATIILVSHLGRPKGKPVPEMSLKPVARKLTEVLKREVKFIETPLGEKLKAEIDALPAGSIVLLENIRFYPGEEKNDKELGKQLASLCDVYVDDAFAAAHRGHSSNDAITQYVKECAAGFLLQDEIEYFKKAMEKPERPLGAIIGGAKVSSKLEALNNIIPKVNFIIIGGGMAFTFLKAKGMEVGKSILEEELVGTAKDIMKNAESKGVELLLPVDVVIAKAFENESPRQVVPVDKIPADSIGLDIGPESVKLFSKKIKSAKTVIWNGPMGAFEMPNFAAGTNQIAETIANSALLSIVGGGDSVTAVNQAGVSEKISYISTGGGAFLELLEGKKLPAIVALDK